jgi:hypothetical protein
MRCKERAEIHAALESNHFRESARVKKRKRAGSARIIDTNAHDIVVLREGNNGFTCMPGKSRGGWGPADVCRRGGDAMVLGF